MPTTVTEGTARDGGTHVAVHRISFNGLAGTLFWCNILALLLYTLGFATVGWQVRKMPTGETKWVGLWHTCTCSGDLYDEFDWFHASKAMFSIGMIGVIFCTLITVIYMFVHTISKNMVIMAYATICMLSVIFMSIGLITFGVKTADNYYGAGGLNFSYAFASVGTILCLICGILALVQMWKSKVV